MPKPKKRKRKGKIRVRTGARVVKKDSARNDTLPKAPTRLASDAGANFKIKIRRKNG